MSSGVSAEFYWIAVAVVSVLSAARLTRLGVIDKFPPVVALRRRFLNLTDRQSLVGYQLLVFCGYCFSFWAALLVVLSGWLSDWHEAWWLVNGVLGGSYAAAIVMAHDGDVNDDEDDD